MQVVEPDIVFRPTSHTISGDSMSTAVASSSKKSADKNSNTMTPPETSESCFLDTVERRIASLSVRMNIDNNKNARRNDGKDKNRHCLSSPSTATSSVVQFDVNNAKARRAAHDEEHYITDSEHGTLWYSQEELQAMSKREKKVAKDAGKKENVAVVAYLRGLENYVSIRSELDARARRSAVRQAVLDEQRKQQLLGRRNPSRICKRSREESKASRSIARQLGRWDEREARRVTSPSRGRDDARRRKPPGLVRRKSCPRLLIDTEAKTIQVFGSKGPKTCSTSATSSNSNCNRSNISKDATPVKRNRRCKSFAQKKSPSMVGEEQPEEPHEPMFQQQFGGRIRGAMRREGGAATTSPSTACVALPPGVGGEGVRLHVDRASKMFILDYTNSTPAPSSSVTGSPTRRYVL